MAHPIYDLVKMVAELILVLLILWVIVEAGKTWMEYLALADSRIVQEHVSGFLSISNFAPKHFYTNISFPKVGHKMLITKNPPLVKIEVGGFLELPTVKFKQKTPVGYVLSNSINLFGDCVEAECKFSVDEYNIFEIEKTDIDVEIKLNH